MTSVASNKPDVIVVGAGLAGLTAALTVAELDFKPLILEAAAEAGGTTLLSEGVFNAFDPERQIRISVDDSPEKHLEQLLRWGACRGNRTLAKVLCYEAPSTLKWLEHLGLELPENVVQAPASPYPRSHIPIKKGHAYVDLLLSEVKKRRLPLLTNCRATHILRNDSGTVNGIRFNHAGKEHTIHSRFGVVLAAGGFTANTELLKRHCPLLAGIASAGTPYCDGTMLLAAQDCGAAVTHMSYFVWDWKDSGVNPSLLTDASRYVLLNAKGRRFIREDVRRRDQIEACLLEPQAKAWLVAYGSNIGDSFPFTKQQLQATMDTYNRTADAGKDNLFGKASELLHRIEHPWQIQTLDPVVISSLGGLCIDAKAHVIDRYGNNINGLVAAGDITGGIHGEWAAKGDCLASAAVFGRVSAFTLCLGR